MMEGTHCPVNHHDALDISRNGFAHSDFSMELENEEVGTTANEPCIEFAGYENPHGVKRRRIRDGNFDHFIDGNGGLSSSRVLGGCTDEILGKIDDSLTPTSPVEFTPTPASKPPMRTISVLSSLVFWAGSAPSPVRAQNTEPTDAKREWGDPCWGWFVDEHEQYRRQKSDI